MNRNGLRRAAESARLDASLCGIPQKNSPSRIRHNRRILPENTGVGRKVTQKATHSGGSRSPQDAA